jgi:hypothetical protein
MPRRRRPVQSLQEAVRPQPQAAPLDTFAAPGGVRSPLADFSGISRTLSGYFADEARKDAERKIQEGEKWAIERPDLVRQIEDEAAGIADAKERSKKLKETFEFLQRSGSIPPAANPYWQIGRNRATARLLVERYRNQVLNRLGQTTTLRGPDGLPVEPVDPDTIISEEWEKIAQSPAIQNFYGAQEAIGIKAQTDAEFRARAASALSAAQEETYRDDLTRELGQQFDRIIAENPAVDSSTLQPITDFLDNEVYGHSVQNPRELVMRALEVSFQRLASVDAEEALRAVVSAQDLVVGGVRLGDDRGEVGLRLEALKDRYRENARAESAKEYQRIEGERRLASTQAEQEYMGILIRAKRDGLSLTTVADQLATKYLAEDESSNKFKGHGAFVVNDLYDAARQLDAARVSDQTVIQQFNAHLGDGDLDSAEALVRSAFKGGSLTGTDYASSLDVLAKRRSLSDFIENSGQFRAAKARYQDARPSGFSPEIQSRLDAESDLRERNFERDYAAFVRSTQGKTNREELHVAWLQERTDADQELLRQRGDQVRAGRSQLQVAVSERASRFQDSEDIIAAGLSNGTLTLQEAQGLREENAKAVAGRERFFQSSAFIDASQFLDAQFRASLGGVEPSAEQLTALDVARQSLRDSFSEKLDAVLATGSPTSFEIRARAAAAEAKREVVDQMFPAGRARIEQGAARGETAQQAAEGANAIANDKALSRFLEARISIPEVRERLSAVDIAPVPHPDVPGSFYQSAANWMSGRDPILGRPTTREDVLGEVYQAAASLPAASRDEAVSAMLSVVGVDATQVLAGKVLVGPDGVTRDRILADIKRLEGQLSAGILLRPDEGRAELEILNSRLEPYEIDVSGYEFPPYTTPFFRSPETFHAFLNDPAYHDFLRRLGLDPEDEGAVQEWENAQYNTIVRTQ